MFYILVCRGDNTTMIPTQSVETSHKGKWRPEDDRTLRQLDPLSKCMALYDVLIFHGPELH